jgi:hypothetical protein
VGKHSERKVAPPVGAPLGFHPQELGAAGEPDRFGKRESQKESWARGRGRSSTTLPP